jgi:hypothetical protein
MIAVVLLGMIAGVAAITLLTGPGPVGVRAGISLSVLLVAGAAAIAVVVHGRNYRRRIEEKPRALDSEREDPKETPSQSQE